MTKLDIINTALAQLSLPLLITTEDASNERVTGYNLIYNQHMQYMLECNNWRFALKTATLAEPIATPENSKFKLYEFKLPNDIARIYDIQLEPINIDNTPLYGYFVSEFGTSVNVPLYTQSAKYDTGEDILYTVNDRVNIKYVTDKPRESLFPGIFITILILKIKQSLLFGTAEVGPQSEQILEARIQMEIKKAIRTGAVQRRLPNVQQDYWFNARYYNSFGL